YLALFAALGCNPEDREFDERASHADAGDAPNGSASDENEPGSGGAGAPGSVMAEPEPEASGGVAPSSVGSEPEGEPSAEVPSTSGPGVGPSGSGGTSGSGGVPV